MTIENDYFEWLVGIISDERHLRRRSYRRLLMVLHGITFRWSIEMDENRAKDGVDLRYRYMYEHGIDNLSPDFFMEPCSVLEMMVALALRMEEQIMSDSEIGDRTGDWFWNMLVSLELDEMYGTNFDREYVDEHIDIFLDRDYEYDGKGGLFTVEDCAYDLKDVEIWYQMAWYLDKML